MRGVDRVADWVRDNLAFGDGLSDSPTPSAEFVRLGDNQVLMHLPYGRSFELTVREITGEVDRG